MALSAASGHPANATIMVGNFKDGKPLFRITAHKLSARFIRFNKDSSALVAFGSLGGKMGGRVIQTVSIAEDSILKRIVVPFTIKSVSSIPLAGSNDLLVTTASGEVWRIDRDSLVYKPFAGLSHGARNMVNHGTNSNQRN